MSRSPQWVRVKPEKNTLHGQLVDLISLLGKAVDVKKAEIEELKRSQNGDA